MAPPGAAVDIPVETARGHSFVARLAIAMCIGIAIGWTSVAWSPLLWVWVAGTVAAAAVSGFAWRSGRVTMLRCWLLIAAACFGAGWYSLDQHRVGIGDVSMLAGPESQLVRLRGVVDDEPYIKPAQRGTFASFAFQSPATLLTMTVDEAEVGGDWRDASGRALVRIEGLEMRLHRGDRIEIEGWISAIDGPMNPGEFDYRAMLARQEIRARVSLPGVDNWRMIEPGRHWTFLHDIRRSARRIALSSLRLGMGEDPGRVALLEAILLGERSAAYHDLSDAFREVGLAHLLSISGAHLGILLGLVWLASRAVVRHPSRVALIVLVVLGLYLLAVPLRVPIVRAAIMAALFAGGYGSGRRFRATDLVAAAAIVVLMWRPGDLFEPGFQLSFLVVLGLVTLTRPVSEWIYPPAHPLMPETQSRWARIGADYVAVSLVAFLLAMPLVAFHFEMITPLAMLLSLLALPVVTVVLGLGYLKVMVGVLLPSVGIALAGPVAWSADTLLNLVEHSSQWALSSTTLSRAPSVWWVIATIGLVVAALSGRFRGRPWAMTVAAAICLGWLVAMARPVEMEGWLPAQPRAEATVSVHMFAVGDGSCFLVEVHGESPYRLMFDCGSQAYFDVAIKSIVPALERLGVSRIDTLVLSHADLDHYGGSLDLADRVPVGEVLTTDYLLREAEASPQSAAAFLIEGLHMRGLSPRTIGQHWQREVGAVQFEMIWPPPGLTDWRSNDQSLVLSIRAAGRRVLLNGDVQQEAIETMLAEDYDLAADVADLAHHGSFVDASPNWLAAVNPAIVLQSSGPRRSFEDPWPALLEPRGIERLLSHHHGMSTVTIHPSGGMSVRRFRDPVE